jgi:hypothetical protein
MKKLITVRQAPEDPALLGGMLGAPSFAVMRTLLIAAMSEPLTAAKMPIVERPHRGAGRSRSGTLAHRGLFL